MSRKQRWCNCSEHERRGTFWGTGQQDWRKE